jgi:hypothetical protein
MTANRKLWLKGMKLLLDCENEVADLTLRASGQVLVPVSAAAQRTPTRSTDDLHLQASVVRRNVILAPQSKYTNQMPEFVGNVLPKISA